MSREISRVIATAIIWSVLALIFGFLLIGESLGVFEFVLGIVVIGCGFAGTAAIWEQLNDSPVHLHLDGQGKTSTHTKKRKGRLDDEQLRRLADSLDEDSAATLLAALQERDGADGEFLSLRRLMDDDSHS